jgi:homoserine/homoserine lactone efflux protein
MNASNWLMFFGVALLVSFTPGPAVLLAISNSLALGPRRTLASSLGNVLGVFIVSALAMAGLGVVLAASANAFAALKLAGAGYLVYLGIRQWRSKQPLFAAMDVPMKAFGPTVSARHLFTQGLGIALTNPKSILFFSALFPQFLTHDAPIPFQFAVLTTTFAACTMMSHAFYVLLARVFKGQLSNPLRARLFNRVSGGAFVVLGISLLGLKNRAA